MWNMTMKIHREITGVYMYRKNRSCKIFYSLLKGLHFIEKDKSTRKQLFPVIMSSL